MAIKKNSAQKKVTKNVEKFRDSRQAAINFYNDYFSMVINGAYDAKQQEGTELKILTPKQMLQRLQIALAQIKVSNNSESLLNEIREIVYSLKIILQWLLMVHVMQNNKKEQNLKY